jgi:NAD(P) transhydrogenase subunit alpha
LRIGVTRESSAGETRVSATPPTVGQLIGLGYEVVVEAGAGAASSFPDEAYTAAGAQLGDPWAADVVFKVNAPSAEEIAKLHEGVTLVSLLSPALNPDLVEALAQRPITALAMDAVPRISRAQSLDVLSSMANIAGYRAVIEAAHVFGRFFTGQVTAAGKVPPAKVLVAGAGVAGLAAIGAASSLGAIVRATDPRPEVAEQVRSLGGDFLAVEVEQEVSSDGYAKATSEDYDRRAAEIYSEQAAEVDIIITTALIPGRPAPKLLTAEQVASMKPGSVIVDMAAQQGGNVAGSRAGEVVVTDNGVTIIGYTDLAGRLAAPPPVQVSAAPTAPATTRPIKEEKPPLSATRRYTIVGIGVVLLFVLTAFSPTQLIGNFTVFVLAVVIGYYVIGNVHHALHTPLMSVTNAISGIIIVGALLQIGHHDTTITVLAFVAILLVSINIFGGFAVTRRMLSMFTR